MRAQILQGPNHKQLGLAALKALPRREISSLPLEVVYPPVDPGVVSSKDLFSGFFDGTDEELTLDFGIAGSGGGSKSQAARAAGASISLRIGVGASNFRLHGETVGRGDWWSLSSSMFFSVTIEASLAF